MSRLILHYVQEITGVTKVERKKRLIYSRWEPPIDPPIKINFNVAFNGISFKYGSGIMARHTRGRVLASRSVLHLDVGSSFIVEALACHYAVKLRLELEVKKVIIEGDSLSIIGKCNDSQDKSKIGAYIQDIKHHRNRFQKV